MANIVPTIDDRISGGGVRGQDRERGRRQGEARARLRGDPRPADGDHLKLPQPLSQLPRLLLAVGREGDVVPPGVLPGQGPFGLPVACKPELRRGVAHSSGTSFTWRTSMTAPFAFFAARISSA